MARRHFPYQEQVEEINAMNMGPPNGLTQSDSGFKDPKKLTPIFNRAARIRSSKQVRPSIEQIKALEKKLSQPAHTHEMTPFGNVRGSYDPNRDRKIREQIKAIEKALAKQKAIKQEAFAKSQMKNKTKHEFNRTTRWKM